MNCKHVQELLPLYVGGDLEEKRARLVATHVQSCGECAGDAGQYRESQQLLGFFTPPEFSDGVLTAMRQRVLREIEQGPDSKTLSQSFASLMRPRIRLAMASALLLAFSATVFYFVVNRGNDRREIAVQPSVHQATEGQASSSRSKPTVLAVMPPSPSTKENDGPERRIGRKQETVAIAGQINGGRRSRPGTNRGASPGPSNIVATDSPDKRSINPKSSSENGDPLQPDAVPNLDSATSAKMLRVEMQTKDRNIRIIWFSPQRTKQNSPGKSTKGNQEVKSNA